MESLDKVVNRGKSNKRYAEYSLGAVFINKITSKRLWMESLGVPNKSCWGVPFLSYYLLQIYDHYINVVSEILSSVELTFPIYTAACISVISTTRH